MADSRRANGSWDTLEWAVASLLTSTNAQKASLRAWNLCMALVEIGHAGSLAFDSIERPADGSIDSVLVTADLKGLHATQRVLTINDFRDLVLFFTDLSAQWRGWTGSKNYEALEGDLRISARHDGHVSLDFEISQTSVPRGWTLAGVLVLDPGDELSKVAQESESFFSARTQATMWACH